MKASSTGCAWITRTACGIRRSISIACARGARCLDRRGKDPRARRATAPELADRRNHGYDFLNRVCGLFIDPEGEAPLTEFYREFTNETRDYPPIVRDKKLFVLRNILGSDVNRLTDLLLQICEKHRRHATTHGIN